MSLPVCLRRSLCAVVLLTGGVSQAAPHLGMKLACRDFGEVMNHGSQSQFASVATNHLYNQIIRLGPDEFAKFRAEVASTGATVVSTSKSNGHGYVTVRTSRGLSRLHLVGNGFRWSVHDVYAPDHRGEWVSLRDRLDATCTVRDFYRNLSDSDVALDSRWMSAEFGRTMKDVPEEQLFCLRDRLGRYQSPEKIVCTLDGDRADIEVHTPSDERVRFELVRTNNGWGVDDVEIDAERFHVASLKGNFAEFCSVVTLAKAMKEPGSVKDMSFVADKDLRVELELLARTGSSDMMDAAQNKSTKGKLRFYDGGRKGIYAGGERTIEVALHPRTANGSAPIESVKITDENGTRDFARGLKMKRQWTHLTSAAGELLLPIQSRFALLLGASGD